MSSGQEPDDTDLKAQSRNAFALILAKLGRRDHSLKELERALGRKGYSEEAVAAALRRAKREGLVNDERLAGAIARMNARSGKRGPLRVVATLRQKGITKEAAQTAAKEAFTGSDEAQTNLVRFTTRLLARAKGDTIREKRIRVVRSLIGRGFGLSEARKALGLAENALIEENTRHDADE